MLMTPREAQLKADNERLRAELAYLRQAVNDPDTKLTPYGAIAEMELRGKLPAQLTLPVAMSVTGALMRMNKYSVVARTMYGEAENLEVAYYCDAVELRSRHYYAINELLPRLHERFIFSLMKALGKVSN